MAGIVRVSPPDAEAPSGFAHDDAALRSALAKQADADADERSLILERLRWSPEERLAANAAFVNFVLSVRPEGPLLRG